MDNDSHPTRKHLLFYLDILDLHTGQLLGHLGDISLDGLMMITDHPMRLNQVRDVLIKLPDGEGLTASSIEAEVEVRWTRPDMNPNLHRIGCRFLKISSQNRELIEQVEKLLGW